MKHAIKIIVALILLAVVAWVAFRPEKNTTFVSISSVSEKSVIESKADEPRLLSSEELMDKALVRDSGDAHSVALDLISECIRLRLVLTPSDRDTMLRFLSESKPTEIASGQWQERVNEILNFLRAQPGEVPGLANLLVQMSSENPDPVLRMYALQHISLWIPKEPVESNKADMIAYLEKLAAKDEDPLAGSAILFLNDLDQRKVLPDRIDASEVIEDAALRLIASKSAKPDVRICALHTSAERKLHGAIISSRAIAGDSSLMIPLRKAAIYTIGEVGTVEDIALLEALAVSNHVLAAATKPAMESIQARNKQL